MHSLRSGISLHFLSVVLLVLSAAADAVAPSNELPRPTSVNVLLWLPVHATEPDAHVHAAADCLLRRWSRPSLSGQTFDIVLTLAGGVEKVDTKDLQSRAASLESIIKASTRHLSPPPQVTSLPITLSADAYDVDEARGGRSSFAGPNELFYGVMIHDYEETDAGAESKSTTRPSAPSTSLSALIADYAFVQVVETDCCATGDGWLDALLQPMLDDPGLLISGSRGRGACWTGAEHDGCTPMVDAAIPHAHLRDHINGNAMYRVGPELTRLATSARDLHGSTVPFDVAMHLVSGGNRNADNGRAYSVMGLPVDEDRFGEAAYYGSEAVVAFVHAPRRLRAPALQAALRRLDVGRPVTVVVVAMRPGGGGVDQALLRRLHGSLLATKEARNAVYLVADEDVYAVLARVAPMRVLMMDGFAEHDQENQAARLLALLASMARAGLATFTMGLDVTVLQPYTPHLMALADGQPGKAWVVDGTTGATSSPSLPGLLFVPGGERAGQFLEAWTGEGNAEHSSIKRVATRHHLSLASLPPDLFPPASSYAGPLWTDAARHNVATVVSWDGWQAPLATPAALSALGLWKSPSATPFVNCANYSMLGTRPLPLASPAAIHQSLSARAAFAGFVREQAIACAVLPGFMLATTGNVVPDETVLGGKGGGLLGNAVVFTSLADLESAGGGAGGGGLGDFVPFEHAARSDAALPMRPTKPVTSAAACAATSCFAPNIVTLIDAALAALPPSYQCALDTTRHTHREVALLSLEEGRLGEVGRLVRQVAGGRKKDQPIFLTGAWRHVGGGRLSNSPESAALPKIITLADLAAPTPAPVDPISRLVRFGFTSPITSLASSPWADVIEFAVCQGARGVHDLADVMPGTPLTPALALARRAALIPPAVLAEDLAALARWLGRPDRPSLASAQRAQLDLADSPVLASDFQDAILAPSLGLARTVGAKVAMLPTLSVPWSSVVGELALRQAYADHAALLPSSVEILLGSQPLSDNTTLGPRLYPASVDVLDSQGHRSALHALEHVLDVAHGKVHILPTMQLPATVSPAQHGRLMHFAVGARCVVLSFLF